MLLRFGAFRRLIRGFKPERIGRDDSPIVSRDIVDRGKPHRRIGVGAACDSAQSALVNLRSRHRHHVPFRVGVVGEKLDLARPVTIVSADTLARIIEPAILVAHCDGMS